MFNNFAKTPLRHTLEHFTAFRGVFCIKSKDRRRQTQKHDNEEMFFKHDLYYEIFKDFAKTPPRHNLEHFTAFCGVFCMKSNEKRRETQN